MALDTLLMRLEKRVIDTPDTICNRGEVSAKSAPIQACTRDTPDTSQNSSVVNDVRKVEADDENAIRVWLAHIEETDPETIAEVFDKCCTDPEALAYFLGRAGEVPHLDDDRRTCVQCANLSERGVCLAAKHGEFFAGRNYQPVRDLPRRCEGYAPGLDDPDRRHGRERWPGPLV